VSIPKGSASDRVRGDHNDRHHRRQNGTKALPSAVLARRRNALGSFDTCCAVSTAVPTTGCAEEMERIVGPLLERPSLGRAPGGRESPHGEPTWRRPIGRRSQTRLGRLGQRPSTTTVHLFGAIHKRMFDTPDLDESGLGERVGYEVVVPRRARTEFRPALGFDLTATRTRSCALRVQQRWPAKSAALEHRERSRDLFRRLGACPITTPSGFHFTQLGDIFPEPPE
jgi:hypothetical protein